LHWAHRIYFRRLLWVRPLTINGARCRVRTCTTAVEHKALTVADSQIDAQKICSDAGLIEFIRLWRRLSCSLSTCINLNRETIQHSLRSRSRLSKSQNFVRNCTGSTLTTLRSLTT
jgi:hypothetical protein